MAWRPMESEVSPWIIWYLEDRGRQMWHKLNHAVSTEQSLKWTAPEWHPGVDLGETNWSIWKRHTANKHNPLWIQSNQNHGAKLSDSVQWMQEKKKKVFLFSLKIVTKFMPDTRKIKLSVTSSDPSAQSYSPLHFKDAEIQPPLAQIYSLEEQVGDAGYKHIF